MTDEQKLTTVKTLIEDGSGYMPTDNTLNTYIEMAGNEILAWMYHLIGGVPEDVTEVPSLDEGAQIYAVVAGYTHAGSEGEVSHHENGITRTFAYTDMIGYIRNHVLPYVRVGAIS